MLLSLALVALFSLITLAVAGVLIDSALRARNACGKLRLAAGSAHRVAPLVRQVEIIEIGTLPAFRGGRSTRSPGQRSHGACPRRPAIAAA